MSLETESDEFLEAFVASMEKMGYSLEEMAVKYHMYRVRERLDTDPLFKEGFEKAASKGRLLAGVGAGIAAIPGLIAGGTALATKQNPFRALGSGAARGAPGLRIKAPDGVTLTEQGTMRLGHDTALEHSLRYRQILENMDRQREQLLSRSSAEGEGLEAALNRSRAAAALRDLERERKTVQSQFVRHSGDWGRQTARAGRDIDSQRRQIEEALERHRAAGDRLGRYIEGTQGSRLASLWHSVPGVNPERKAYRMLAEQRRLEADLERALRARQSLDHIGEAKNRVLNRNTPSLGGTSRDRMLGGR